MDTHRDCTLDDITFRLEEPFLGFDKDWPMMPTLRGFQAAHAYEVGLDCSTRKATVDLFTIVLTNLILADAISLWVSFSRNQNWYRNGPRGYTYGRMMKVVNNLHCLGLIQEQRASRGHRGRQSRMRASQRLAALLKPPISVTEELGDLLIMRNGRKMPVSFAETDVTRERRSFVAKVNEMVSSIHVTSTSDALAYVVNSVQGRIILPHQRRYRRIFNMSWDWGGRFYGHFVQNLPKAERKLLLFDGAATEEIDHRHLHPALLYALFGHKMEGEDAYTIPGLDIPRNTVKLAFQLLINARSERLAVRALARDAGLDRRVALAYLDALRDRHRPIAGCFYRCPARYLQFLDSELLVSVLEDLMARGISSVSVHDSVVVKTGSDAEHAREIMASRLDELLRRLPQMEVPSW